MSRAFDGIDDVITFSAGAAATLQNGAFSLVFLVKLNSNHRGGLYSGTATGTRRLGVNPFDNNEIFINITGSGFTSVNYSALIGDWAVIGLTKASGSAAVRAHLYDYGTSLWSHTDLGSLADGSGTVDSIFVGSFDPGQFLNANVAAYGLWTGTALADASFEASGGFQTSLANWFNLTPSVLWRFNQASTADPVTDLMGSGADQTAITGTTVSVDDPPGFSYALVATGTGTADLGSLDAAGTGIPSVSGVALADLGRLVAVATTPDPPDPDQFVWPLAEQLLACLCQISAANEGAPTYCCYRVGTEIAHDAGQFEDLCCEGLAYVTLGDTYFSSDSFPEADIVRQASQVCAPTTWAQVFQVGIIRCVPVGDLGAGPSCTEWDAAFRQNVIDTKVLREVACCMRNFVANNNDKFLGMSLVIDRQLQGNPQGGCIERTMKITAQFPNICDGC